MADEDEIPKAASMGGIVPHFYYDLLGRIVPGTYFLVAAHWLVQLKGTQPSLGNSLSVTTTLISGLAAYAVTFVIGPCSYFVFDVLPRFFGFCRFDEDDITDDIRKVLKENKIAEPAPDKKGRSHSSIVNTSDLCSYSLWVHAPQLAIICSRWDAEAFAARQFGTVTIILSIIATWLWWTGSFRPESILVTHTGAIFFLALCVIILSGVQFQYSRRRAILGRFAMLSRVPEAYDRAARISASTSSA